MAGPRVIRTVHTEAVGKTRSSTGQVAVPDGISVLTELDPLDFRFVRPLGEEAQLHRFRMLAEQREIHAVIIRRGPKGEGLTCCKGMIHGRSLVSNIPAQA